MIERGWEVHDAKNEKRLGVIGAVSETMSMHQNGNRKAFEFFIHWDDGSEGWVGEADVVATGRRSPTFPPVDAT